MVLNKISGSRLQLSSVFSKSLVKAFVSLKSVLIIENANVINKLLLLKLVVICSWCLYFCVDSNYTLFLIVTQTKMFLFVKQNKNINPACKNAFRILPFKF